MLYVVYIKLILLQGCVLTSYYELEFNMASSGKVVNITDSKTELFSFGQYEYLFVGDIPNYFICSVCQGVLKDCLTTECCYNSFCAVCLERAKKRNASCPICRKEPVSTTSDKKTDRLVGQLKVLCRFSTRGCTWKGELSDVEGHVNKTCLEAIIKCPLGCNAEIERKVVDDHVLNSCVKRKSSCTSCGHTAPYDRLQSEHFDKEGRCPMEALGCRFKYFGCTEEVKRCEAEEHELSYLSKHLNLVEKLYRRDITLLISKVGALEKEIKLLKAQQMDMSSTRAEASSSDRQSESKVEENRKKVSWKNRSNFQSNEEYGEYISSRVKKGMMVRLLEAYESVQEGDVGVFMQSNSLKPPAQVKWLLYGQPYWVFWHQLEIVSFS